MSAIPKLLKGQQLASLDILLEPVDNNRLANLCGQFDQHLQQVEKRLNVEINHRGNAFRIIGNNGSTHKAAAILKSMYDETVETELNPKHVQVMLQESGIENMLEKNPTEENRNGQLALRSKTIQTRGKNQCEYIKRIQKNDISFGIGPAGTGKTYLAVAAAVDALENDRVRRLILARPAVEAGERLGFLPGDMAQKIDPYLRPLYDALYELLGFEQVGKLIERHVIEVAPLAFMRGRTLNDAFVILDEAQNTTVEQMKMFLTRIGFGSTVVVTGDMTQTDLPSSRQSGLQHSVGILSDVEGISFTFFEHKDVVRHPLVQRVVAAYDAHDQVQNPKS
ncbi:MAG: PhoH family protein [Gammaproteobacteria bacterium]|nr:PhoH family protein [Gammaproteobacteria bacterium]